MTDPVKDVDATTLGSAARESAANVADAAKASLGSTVATIKEQAAQAAGDAKGTVASIAGEARQRITDIVDQQKAAGADTISGVARAAQTAASDLEGTSPQVARFVRTAADGVERIAKDIRSSDLNDVVASLTDFGRRQPVAFFGGAILAGFVLARFLKSDAAVVASTPRPQGAVAGSMRPPAGVPHASGAGSQGSVGVTPGVHASTDGFPPRTNDIGRAGSI